MLALATWPDGGGEQCVRGRSHGSRRTLADVHKSRQNGRALRLRAAPCPALAPFLEPVEDRGVAEVFAEELDPGLLDRLVNLDPGFPGVA